MLYPGEDEQYVVSWRKGAVCCILEKVNSMLYSGESEQYVVS